MKKVLVVDDSPLTRQLVVAAARAVTGANAEFQEAGDGGAALRLLAAHKYDLVVCDLNMPVLDGHALLARLRGMISHRTTPVIILSSLVNDANAAQLRAAGANVVLKKPFTQQQIRDSLHKFGLVA
ncbi:MAG: response regulator [Myxococcota bacterium]